MPFACLCHFFVQTGPDDHMICLRWVFHISEHMYICLCSLCLHVRDSATSTQGSEYQLGLSAANAFASMRHDLKLDTSLCIKTCRSTNFENHSSVRHSVSVSHKSHFGEAHCLCITQTIAWWGALLVFHLYIISVWHAVCVSHKAQLGEACCLCNHINRISVFMCLTEHTLCVDPHLEFFDRRSSAR